MIKLLFKTLDGPASIFKFKLEPKLLLKIGLDEWLNTAPLGKPLIFETSKEDADEEKNGEGGHSNIGVEWTKPEYTLGLKEGTGEGGLLGPPTKLILQCSPLAATKRIELLPVEAE